MGDETVGTPLRVRLRLGRAAAQVVADRIGADLLHIKGDVVDARLGLGDRPSTDVDVLVRPRDVAALDEALRGEGWTLYSSFRAGSPFGHAQTYFHATWGHLDLHRLFPGFTASPDEVFRAMWARRTTVDVAGIGAAVPDLTDQAVLLIVNAARSPGSAEAHAIWDGADAAAKARLRARVEEFGAQTAFAAARGDLPSRRDARDHDLWRVISEGGSRTDEWLARIRAAVSLREKVAVVLRAPLVNTEQLAHDLGRRPTPGEVAVAFARRLRDAGRDVRTRRHRSAP